MSENLTKAEYAILGLLVEKPVHGYDLERLIEQRGMREWTELGFSSIYYILKKLESRGIVCQLPPHKAGRNRKKTYAPTDDGRLIHQKFTLQFISQPHAVYPAVLLGIANWPSVECGEALDALRQRRKSVERTLAHIRTKRGFLPGFVEVQFDYSIGQLRAELDWIERSLVKLGEKP